MHCASPGRYAQTRPIQWMCQPKCHASVDFDFFSSRPLDQHALTAALPFTCMATALQATPDTLTLLASDTDAPHGEVKVSLFAVQGLGRVGQPEPG